MRHRSYSATCSLSTTESSTVLAKTRTLPRADVFLKDNRERRTGDGFAFNLKKVSGYLAKIYSRIIKGQPNATLECGPFCSYFTSAAQPLANFPTAPSTSAGRLVPPIGLLCIDYFVVLNS